MDTCLDRRGVAGPVRAALQGLGLAGVLWLSENFGLCSQVQLYLAGSTRLCCLGTSVHLQ